MHAIKLRLGASRKKSWLAVMGQDDYDQLNQIAEWKEKNRKEFKAKVIRRIANKD